MILSKYSPTSWTKNFLFGFMSLRFWHASRFIFFKSPTYFHLVRKLANNSCITVFHFSQLSFERFIDICSSAIDTVIKIGFWLVLSYLMPSIIFFKFQYMNETSSFFINFCPWIQPDFQTLDMFRTAPILVFPRLLVESEHTCCSSHYTFFRFSTPWQCVVVHKYFLLFVTWCESAVTSWLITLFPSAGASACSCRFAYISSRHLVH